MEHIPERKQTSVLKLILAATRLHPSSFKVTVLVFINWHLHMGFNTLITSHLYTPEAIQNTISRVLHILVGSQ